MTDYNDGKWHGWNGGVCPVHPESTIRAMRENGIPFGPRKAAELLGWDARHDNKIIAFRVIKEHREPREFWLVNRSVAMETLAGAQTMCDGHDGYTITHVREVLE